MDRSQRMFWVKGLSRGLGASVMMAMLLSGCSSNPEYYYVPEEDPGRASLPGEVQPADAGTDSVESEEAQYSYVEPVPEAISQRPSSVEQLIRQSDQMLRVQRYEEAASLLERALRITPSDADLYYRLGTVRFRQGRYEQAEQLARRGMSLAHDSQQRKDLQRLIAESQKG